MIEVRDLSKTYDRGRRRANKVLKDISFTLPDKGFVCILGPSGCGKTSLLNAVGGLDVFDGGTLSIDGRSFSRSGNRAFEAERNSSFGYIFQNYYLLEDHSVAYNVYLGLHSLKLSHSEKIQRVRRALRAVEMERYIRRKVGELSGGQQQRVAIARALARRPRVIFADEPTGNLDEGNTRNICSLLRQASKESLVIMVTHEERIARFFADRIITIDSGIISTDSDSWQRQSLAAGTGSTVYTDGLKTSFSEDGAVKLRLFQEEGAAPVELTVAVLGDRIVLKLSDQRAISLGSDEDSPLIIEGAAPDITPDYLENTESEAQAALFSEEETGKAKAGSGVSLPMMAREARQLKKEKGLRRVGMRAFLILLTVLTLLTVGDFIALSRVDPEDFVTADSHLLLLTVTQGSELDGDNISLSERANGFIRRLAAGGPDFDLIPVSTVRASYSATVFPQLGAEAIRTPVAFSYVPITRLDESTLIYGRMPQNSQEIVVDRLVLKAMLEEEESIVGNTITDISYFIGADLKMDNRNYTLTVVGICDSGERSAYISRSTMLAIRNVLPIYAIGLSEFKSMDPSQIFCSYKTVDDLKNYTLADNECIVNVYQAGVVYDSPGRIGTDYLIGLSSERVSYTITDVISILDDKTGALVILKDSQINELLLRGFTDSVWLYCKDKAEVRQYIDKIVRENGDPSILVRVDDPYQSQYDAYSETAHLRADVRSMITATVLVLCLVMLYLLCRIQAEERIGLIAVYRLLGIPGRKLHAIFLIEGAGFALTAILPTAFVTWAALAFISVRTEIELPVVLPWQAATVTACGILIYYLVTAVIPLFRLLSLPPARLAARYDM